MLKLKKPIPMIANKIVSNHFKLTLDIIFPAINKVIAEAKFCKVTISEILDLLTCNSLHKGIKNKPTVLTISPNPMSDMRQLTIKIHQAYILR